MPAGPSAANPQTLNTIDPSVRRPAINLLLFAASIVLWAAAFPNMLFPWGLWPLGWVALAPAVLALRRSTMLETLIVSPLFGWLTYALFNYWLGTFHPLAMTVVALIYAGYYLVLFPVLKLAERLFPSNGFLVQIVIWLAYEYLRTLGYLGYPYGIIGYSQYLFLPLVRLSSITGVWGVSALVVAPSFFVGWMLDRPQAGFGAFVRRHRVAVGVWVALLVAAITWGMATRVDYSGVRHVRMALVQQNVDPWQGGSRAYRRSLDALIRQSEAALAEHPGIEMVVWSETSFVPAIDYHRQFRANRDNWEIVRELLDYMERQDVPFVIGNDDGQRAQLDGGSFDRVEYNAVLLFEDGDIADRYWKTHLVPFTEHFPYQNLLPGVQQLLLDFDTHFWEAGTEYTVFESLGFRFSSPICFEDSFGYLNRRFVKNGAEVLVNLTNDSWANSETAMVQHAAMAVFRATENRRSMVRSTNGGFTTLIDPNGQIVDWLPMFSEDYLVVDVPIYTEGTTLYTRFGDWFAWTALLAAAGLLGWGGICALTAARGQRTMRKSG